MKKILAVILAAAVVCTSAMMLAGCGGSNTGKGDSGNADNSGNSASKGELHMATNAEFPPYEYMENKKIIGIDADIAQRGVIVVGSRLFGEMIRRLPDGIVTVSTDEKDNISVKCGKSHFNILGMSAEDYPELPSFDAVNSISLPQHVLKDMINKTIFAVSTDEVRPIYTGTLFEVEEDRLTLVSVDGYRLAKRTEKLDNSRLESCTFVVPGSALSDVEKI